MAKDEMVASGDVETGPAGPYSVAFEELTTANET